MFTEVFAATAKVVTVKLTLVDPAGTVMLDGTVAIAVLSLVNETTAPPLGAALLRLTVPCEVLPPTTFVGLSAREDRTGAAGAAWGVKVRVEDQEPATPMELTPRTRHHNCLFGNPPMVVCETVTDWVATNGELMLLESSI